MNSVVSFSISRVLSRLLAPLMCFAQTADGQLPPLIPRDVMLGNPQKEFPQISPDGTRLAYLAPFPFGQRVQRWHSRAMRSAPSSSSCSRRATCGRLGSRIVLV